MNLFCVYTVYLCDNSVKKVLSKMGIWDRIYKEGMAILRREGGVYGEGSVQMFCTMGKGKEFIQ